MLVDDEGNILRSLRRLLRGQFEITTTVLPQEALRHLAEDEYAVLLSDQRMPAMEGTELMTKARAVSPDTVRILLTGDADLNTAMTAINQAGAYRFLQKPWNDVDLVATLGQATQYFKLVKENKRLQALTEAQNARLKTFNQSLKVKVLEQTRQVMTLNEELSNTLEELGSFFNLSVDMLCIAGLNGYFKRLNPAFEKTLGHMNTELLASPLLDFVHPDDYAATIAEVEKLATGTPTVYFENRFRCKDGTYKWLAWTAKPELEPGLFYAIARDITERKQYEAALIHAREEAEAANRLKSAILANMNHEIRTPLAAIMGFSTLLVDELPARYHRFMRIIQQSGERLLDTLTSILDLSILDAGCMKLNREKVNVARALYEKGQLLRPLAEKKGLQLHVESGAPEIWALLDRVLLDRILNKLVDNAIKFTKQGHVSARVNIVGDRVVIQVSDTGIGISEKFLPRLFDGFQQESTGPTRAYEGIGLGLAITRRLVELMDGEVSVASRRGTHSSATEGVVLSAGTTA